MLVSKGRLRFHQVAARMVERFVQTVQRVLKESTVSSCRVFVPAWCRSYRSDRQDHHSYGALEEPGNYHRDRAILA